MKKTITLLVLLALCRISLFSQYVLVPVSPPPMFTFNDLWHFTIQGAATDSASVFYVSMRVHDENNLLKLKSNTSIFTLGGNLNYFNLSNIAQLQPFTTSYYDGGLLQGVVASGGQFPAGTYNIVFTLFGKFADGEFAPLYEDASQVTVEALWPPMLLSPPDGDTIDTQYPLLTWTPAFASFYNGLITYTLNMVEILPGQNAYQAIQSNPYYFTQNNIPVTMLNYPPSAQLLDTSKSYAWQVHAEGNGSPMGSSEVWQFTFGVNKAEQLGKDSIAKLFHELERDYPARFISTNEKVIRFKYINTYNQDSLVNIKFKLFREGDNDSNSILSSEDCQECLLHTGTVYYSLDFEKVGDGVLMTPGFYLLFVYDSYGTKKYLRVLYVEE